MFLLLSPSICFLQDRVLDMAFSLSQTIRESHHSLLKVYMQIIHDCVYNQSHEITSSYSNIHCHLDSYLSELVLSETALTDLDCALIRAYQTSRAPWTFISRTRTGYSRLEAEHPTGSGSTPRWSTWVTFQKVHLESPAGTFRHPRLGNPQKMPGGFPANRASRSSTIVHACRGGRQSEARPIPRKSGDQSSAWSRFKSPQWPRLAWN